MKVHDLLPLSDHHPSFRLLELDLNSDEEATVHATMSTYDFENAPDYEALSYTWGTRDESANIKVNAQWFPVSPNLLAALKQLRLNHGKNGEPKRMLWIDAICINQSNNSEKSHQVMRMKDIYVNASNVLVERVIRIKSILMAKGENSFSVTETRLREMASEVTSLETYPFTGEPFWIVFFRTLTADRTALSPRINEDYRAKFMNAFGDWKLNDEGNGQNLPARVWAEVSKDIGAIIEDKDIFLTTQGYLGLGHEGFAIGDLLCIFSGGEVPFLLRRSGSMPPHDEMFQFLSECYIHGVMDGEATKNIESDYLEPLLIE